MLNPAENSALPPSMRFTQLWRNKWRTAEATSIPDMIDALQRATDHLRTLQARGVVLNPDSSIADDYALLVTTDPGVAQEFGFESEEATDEEE